MIFSGHASRMSFQSMVLILMCVEAMGQGGAKKTGVDSDTSAEGSAVSPHSLFAGAGYGSNMIWLGSTISKSRPYGYGALTYGFRNEFYASFSSVHLSTVDPFFT